MFQALIFATLGAAYVGESMDVSMPHMNPDVYKQNHETGKDGPT